jgi:hypothetical protein
VVNRPRFGSGAVMPAAVAARRCVDLVLLDANVGGCVSTWRHTGGRLDAACRSIVRECLRELDRALPRLTDGHERRYVERLRELARLLVRADG